MAIIEILLGPMFVWCIAEIHLILIEIIEGAYSVRNRSSVSSVRSRSSVRNR